jgi:hypothetical protein
LLEDRSRARECRIELGHQLGDFLERAFSPALFETHRQIAHLMCTNRAGDALEGVRGALNCCCVVGGGGRMQGAQAFFRFCKEALQDTGDNIRTTWPLELPQAEQR